MDRGAHRLEWIGAPENLNQAGVDSSGTDNVLLEWIAALELFDRSVVRGIIPLITMDDGGHAFDWGLPKQLSGEEHTPTITAARKHLIGHPSSSAIASESELLNGVSSIVSSVSNSSADDDGLVTNGGVVNAVLRFQGCILSERSGSLSRSPRS